MTSAVAIGGFSFTSPGAARGDDEDVIRLKRAWENPITLEELRQTKFRAMEQHKKEGGATPEYFIDATPVFPADARIVDYVVMVQPNGQPVQHVEVVGEPSTVPQAHADAGEAAEEFRERARSSGESSKNQGSSGGVSTMQTTGSDWNRITDDQGSYKKCPYGEVKHNFVWWKLDESVDDSGEDMHAVKQIASMTPGDDDGANTSPCTSDSWHNEWMMVKNDWDQTQLPSPAIHDWDPYDTSANTVDVSISAGTGGGGLSWSFDNDGSIRYYVNGNRVRWELHGIFGTERNITQTMKPGSICNFGEPACGSTNQLTYLRMEGHFEDNWTNKYHLYFYWNIDYSRYC